MIDTDDGYHHYGREIAVPTSDRMTLNDPETVIKVSLKAWTPRPDGAPGPTRIELQLGTAEVNTDMFAELTSDEARAVASALAELAAVADGAAVG
jgi:hypothetical protein